MEKGPTSTVTVDFDTAARLEKRARETGQTSEQLIAALVRQDDEGERTDPSVIADLDSRWAEVEAGGAVIPHQEVRRWMETWGTPSFKPWPKSR